MNLLPPGPPATLGPDFSHRISLIRNQVHNEALHQIMEHISK
jgi:hypothetical protein